MAEFVRFRFPPATNAPGGASKTSAALDRPTGLSVVDGARQWYGMAREKSGMKPGRNDPCPCGSGKKYKKCCLGKAAQSPATKAVAERRFRFPVHSFYTQAALEEALKPGGTIEIHPYVLLKLRE